MVVVAIRDSEAKEGGISNQLRSKSPRTTAAPMAMAVDMEVEDIKDI
jgi:hypothetical protein